MSNPTLTSGANHRLARLLESQSTASASHTSRNFVHVDNITNSTAGLSASAAPPASEIPLKLAMILKQLAVESAGQFTAGRMWERRVVSAPVRVGVQLQAGADTTQHHDADHPCEKLQHADHPGTCCRCRERGVGFCELHQGWITDISASGVGLLLEHDLPANHIMALDLKELAGEAFVIPICIVYCRQVLPNTWRIGAAFEFETMRKKIRKTNRAA